MSLLYRMRAFRGVHRGWAGCYSLIMMCIQFTLGANGQRLVSPLHVTKLLLVALFDLLQV